MKKALWIAALGLALSAHAQVNIDVVKVPGGCYAMGSETGEKHERPVHQACVKDFEIGRTEVTQGQWKALMGGNASKFAISDAHPVEMVSFNEVQEFLRRLNATNTGAWRLPTEAEWEYACRSGGKDETYAGTSNPAELSQVAWYNKDEAGNMTHPVATKRANGLGIHDMSGNVWEWTSDAFVTPYGGDKPEARYVTRGGSWDGKLNYVRCALRNRYDAERRDPRIGFRVVRELR